MKSVPEKINQVYRTHDYDMFVFMKENRAIRETRKRKVRKSIIDNGYIFNPIIVNDKMEIIDGQCRFEVLREMNLPIDFIVQAGLGAKECIALNTTVTQWGINDYIESYMNQGIVDYKYLWHLTNKFFSKGIRLPEIMFAVTGKVEYNNNVKNGLFKCTDDQMEEAEELLDYLSLFTPMIIKAKKGNGSLLSAAIIFAARGNYVDRQKLIDNFNKYYLSDFVPPVTNTESAFKALNAVYNYHSSKKVHLEIEYEQFQMNHYLWYEQRYAQKKKEE